MPLLCHQHTNEANIAGFLLLAISSKEIVWVPKSLKEQCGLVRKSMNGTRTFGYIRAVSVPAKEASMAEAFYAVMKKTGWRCYYCGKPRARGASNRGRIRLTIDHVVPTSNGGTDDLENLVPACRWCNSAKGQRTTEEFRHSSALKRACIPYGFTEEQIAWMRLRNCDLGDYDARRQFWFERESEGKNDRTSQRVLANAQGDDGMVRPAGPRGLAKR